MHALTEMVRTGGACSLPGVSINYNKLAPMIQRAVLRGFVSHEHGDYVLRGLWDGFDLGVDPSLLKGKQHFRNYPSSINARPYVSKATRSRVVADKTIRLGLFNKEDRHLLPWDAWRIFPLGAVPKPLEPNEMRPVSDHTRTGLKAATNVDFFRHTLNTYEEIAAFLKSGYFLRVGDIDGAFPLLPLAPHIWPHFMFHWYDINVDDCNETAPWCLYMHVCGDFGAAGLPGTWKIFFSDVMVGVARSEGVLTLPLCVYVDDTGTIGADRAAVDREGIAFREFLKSLGVFMKELKERAAATLQLMLGFWWDSLSQTRTLEERKFHAYVSMLGELSSRKSMSLREMQQAAGRMQRAIMTLPPGASCLLAGLFALMRGLSLPWQQRRVTRANRNDFSALKELLELNLGKGYYSFDQFARASAVYTDASKSRAYVGGGYVSCCGRYRYWRYGVAAAKNLIDYLEGDAFVLAVEDLGERWRRCVVPCYIDNRAFGDSARKGWSRAERLGALMKKLFALAIKYECIYEIHWIASAQNTLADALSREDNEARFLELIVDYHDFFEKEAVLRRHPQSGFIRRFGPEFSSDDSGDGPPARGSVSASYYLPPASIFASLPSNEIAAEIDEILDSRLSTSSIGNVSAALALWDIVWPRHGWARIIASEDLARGSKLATYVSYMVNETELHANTISNYVWALRAWMKYQRQYDPIIGVVEWSDFMQGVHVVAWMHSEPRRRVPLSLIDNALACVNVNVFWEVQAAVLMLMLLFSFARSETPCPKSFTGEGALDMEKHLLVEDVRVKSHGGKPYVAMRLKAIKQDGLIERPEAADQADWIILGDAEHNFSIIKWIRLLFAHHKGPRDPRTAFFQDKDRKRWLTYSNAMRDVRALWARASSEATASLYGLHSLRVAGYNAAKQGKHGVALAVAHGGWMSSAHERYDRFSIDDVIALAHVVASGATADANSVSVLQRVPAVGVQPTRTTTTRPRPDLIRSGTGSVRGCKRAATRSQQAGPSHDTGVGVQRALTVSDRIEVWWTEEKRWFAASITKVGRGRVCTVHYDLDGDTCVHDLDDVTWRRL